MGENVSAIVEQILPEIDSWCGGGREVGGNKKITIFKTGETIAKYIDGKTKKSIKNEKLITNIFVVVKRPEDFFNIPNNLKNVPIFHWKRLHIRILHSRGIRGYR